MKNSLPVALQVYSVREEAKKDFAGAMRRVKQMGYDGVELAGLYDLEPAYIRQVLDDLNLPAVSAHVPYSALTEQTQKTIRDYATIGCTYVAIPSLPEALRPGDNGFLQEAIPQMRRIGQACREEGITLLYHNHDFEFYTMPDGLFALDTIYEQVSAELLQTELDTCWVKVAGQNPVAYIEKYAGRSPVVHLKDFYSAGKPSGALYELIGEEKGPQPPKRPDDFEFRPVGHGVQDMPAILAASVAAGAKWVVVEQDKPSMGTDLQDAQKSIDYLRSFSW